MISPHILRQRSRMLQAVRNFFLSRDYLEVDTPIRLPTLIPEAEIEPIRSEDFFLQTSPELCMKRLLAAGHERLFQICHCFRKGEQGRLHAQEFTMLEWYRTGWSYRELMEECEQLVQEVVRACAGEGDGDELARQGRRVSMRSPWTRLTVEEAFARYAGCSAREAVAKDRFDLLLVDRVEPELGLDRPLFLYDYPSALASLARTRDDDPELAERFELYIAGVELANGFSELTDPAIQRSRFMEEITRAGQHGRRAALPEKFLAALAELPPCAGIALGLDRLLMLCAGADCLARVVPMAQDEL